MRTMFQRSDGYLYLAYVLKRVCIGYEISLLLEKKKVSRAEGDIMNFLQIKRAIKLGWCSSVLHDVRPSE